MRKGQKILIICAIHSQPWRKGWYLHESGCLQRNRTSRTQAHACQHTHTHRVKFSLFMVVMLIKSTNIELVSTESLFLGEIQCGSHELLVTFPSTDQNITLFYLYFCLKTPYVIYTLDSLTLNSRPAAL